MQFRDAVLPTPGAQGHPEAFGLAVVHLPARLPQLGDEVAECAPEQHQALAVQRHPLQGATGFDQQNAAMATGVAGPEALFQRG